MARPETVTRLGRTFRDGTQRAASWIEALGRLGFVAKGIVYLLVGVLAAEAAVGAGGGTTGSKGAMRHVLRLPFGGMLLLVVAVGLGGYALWRLVQALLDSENEGAQPRGIAIRIGYLVIGLVHAALAWSAVELARGQRTAGDETSSRRHTAQLLSLPFGPWLVTLLGAVVVCVGLFQFYQAVTARFREKLVPMVPGSGAWTVRLGRIGYAARGVVFCIIGGFLVSAGIQADPHRTHGVPGALRALAGEPAGPWLFGAVAVGLVAYGVFMLLLARYRRMLVR